VLHDVAGCVLLIGDGLEYASTGYNTPTGINS
jgi:hypothetical protein